MHFVRYFEVFKTTKQSIPKVKKKFIFSIDFFLTGDLIGHKK